MEELKTLQKIANPDRDNAGPYKLYPSHLQHTIPCCRTEQLKYYVANMKTAE